MLDQLATQLAPDRNVVVTESTLIGVSNAIDVSVGQGLACAIVEGESAPLCWGDNISGALGRSGRETLNEVAPATLFDGLADRDFRAPGKAVKRADGSPLMTGGECPRETGLRRIHEARL